MLSALGVKPSLPVLLGIQVEIIYAEETPNNCCIYKKVIVYSWMLYTSMKEKFAAFTSLRISLQALVSLKNCPWDT